MVFKVLDSHTVDYGLILALAAWKSHQAYASTPTLRLPRRGMEKGYSMAVPPGGVIFTFPLSLWQMHKPYGKNLKKHPKHVFSLKIFVKVIRMNTFR